MFSGRLIVLTLVKNTTKPSHQKKKLIKNKINKKA